MFFLFRTRAKARALIGVALAGAVLGIVVGAAYLAGARAEAAVQQARIGPLANAARAGYALAARSPTPRAIALADNGLRPAQEPDPAPLPPAPLPPASLRPRAASPFHLVGAVGTSRDIDCLSEAVYYEARGESAEGQAAVAQVVLNRARQPAFPKSVCGVVFQGCQFSFACNGAMRGQREAGAWLRARAVAARALGGYVMAAVGRATSFHAARLGGPGRLIAQVGGHVFFGAGGSNRDTGRVFVAEIAPTTPPTASPPSLPAQPAAVAATLAPAAPSTAS